MAEPLSNEREKRPLCDGLAQKGRWPGWRAGIRSQSARSQRTIRHGVQPIEEVRELSWREEEAAEETANLKRHGQDRDGHVSGAAEGGHGEREGGGCKVREHHERWVAEVWGKGEERGEDKSKSVHQIRGRKTRLECAQKHAVTSGVLWACCPAQERRPRTRKDEELVRLVAEPNLRK